MKPTTFMYREYTKYAHDLVRTNLVVVGPNGRQVTILDLTPAQQGQLTKAGIEKF